MKFWKKRGEDRGPKPEHYFGLRQMALNVTAEEVNVVPSGDHPLVWGALMEFLAADIPVTLVLFGDGGVSLYFGNGGGIIGAGDHERVRTAANTCFKTVERDLALFDSGDEQSLPDPGHMVFHVRTFNGPKSAMAPEDELTSGGHPLAEAFRSAHEVIAQIRFSTPA